MATNHASVEASGADPVPRALPRPVLARSAPRTVLVPLDGSELADRILPHVEALLGAEPYDVVLLRVLEPVLPAASPAGPTVPLDEREAAEAHLAAVRRRLERTGARVTTTLRAGDPAAEVLFATADLRPTLVAMSSHGRSGVLRWVRGSVAERVLRAGTAPLLLVSPKPDTARPWRFERILVPLDGSADHARAVLPLVEELGRRHGAEVLLLHVAPLAPPPFTPASGAADEALRDARARLADAGVPARVLEAAGGPGPGILAVAAREGVDLIAMATHGRTGAARLLEGSVCEEVLRSGRWPILAVHVATT